MRAVEYVRIDRINQNTSGFGGNITTTSQIYIFEVALGKGEAVDLNVLFTHSSGDIDIDIEIHNKEGLLSTVAFFNSSDKDESGVFTASESGVFWLKVYGFNGATNTFDVNISFEHNETCFPVGKAPKLAIICF